MQVWNVLHAARLKYKTQKIAIWHHRKVFLAISLQLRHVSTIRKKLATQQYLFHLSSHYGELRPTNGWDRFGSLGHPSKFQPVLRLGFITAPTSFNRGQQNFGCLVVSCAGTLYIHFWELQLAKFRKGAPLRNLASCKIHFASKSCVLLYWHHYCTALKQRASAKLCGVVQGMELRNFRRERHLYLAGRP